MPLGIDDAEFLGAPVVLSDGSLWIATTAASTGKKVCKIVNGRLGDCVATGGSGIAVSKSGTVYATGGGLFAITSSGPTWSSRAPIYGSPAILPDDTIVTIAENRVIAFAPNGAERWSYQAPNTRFHGSPAITSTGLIIVEGRPTDALTPHLFALRADGTKAWDVLASGYSATRSPAITDSGVIVMLTLGGLMGFNQQGTQIFSSRVNIDLEASDFPVIFGDKVWWGGRDSGVWVDATTGNASARDIDNTNLAVGAGDGTLIFLSRHYDGHAYRLWLRAVHPDRGSLWDLELENDQNDLSPPAIGPDGTIYVAGGAFLFAIGD